MPDTERKPLRHSMRLQDAPFLAMKSGKKTVEMRLWDEKRRLIRVGDEIEFSMLRDKNRSFAVRVTSLTLFPDFASLYAAIPPKDLGYRGKEIAAASPDDMLAYYSPEEQRKWGVVAIGVELLDGGAQTLTPVSRYLSLVLRHCPEAAGVTLDEHGWADTETVVAGLAKKYPGFTRADLKKLVADDAKQRYTLSEDGKRIRAAQGHSVAVDLEPEEAVPPEVLYHGTVEAAVEGIRRCGLLARGRQYVHMTEHIEEAALAGSRRGSPVMVYIDAGQMARDGCRFFRADNGVWLTRIVPVNYLRIDTDFIPQ